MPIRRQFPIRPIAVAALLAAGIASLAEARTGGAADDGLERVTRTGTVVGVAADGAQSYRGIPFAAPPVGPLRFAPPEPAASWEGVREARAFGPACPQAGDMPQSEDCLTLDVYAPAGAEAGDGLPVMVWLHGGALVSGAGSLYHGEGLAARQGVIMVTPNYRLGALGFFAHPALGEAGAGNYALLDQQAALRWVAENIQAFGGDPGNVTLFGESAGATSTCTQIAIPESRAFFHRAILQSDTCIFPDQTVTRDEALVSGEAMAAALGCGEGADAATCLREVPVATLLSTPSGRWGNGGADSWSPMTGGDVLPLTPRARFERGEAGAMPVLMGSNRDEGRFFANVLFAHGAFETQEGYERALARGIRPDVLPDALAEYAPLAERSRYEALASMITDSHFACPMLTLHRLRDGRAPDYVYEFEDPNALEGVPTAEGAPPQGAYHGAELLSIWQHRILAADPAHWSASQRALAERMQDHWGAFARTGDPAAEGAGAWPVFDGRAPLLLSPTREGFAADFAERHRCEFWNARGY